MRLARYSTSVALARFDPLKRPTITARHQPYQARLYKHRVRVNNSIVSSMKRKNRAKDDPKRVKRRCNGAKGGGNEYVNEPVNVCHPVLQCYYSRVTNLRQYILEKVSRRTKRRLQRLEKIGLPCSSADNRHDLELLNLLDLTLVAYDDLDKIDSLVTIATDDLITQTYNAQRSSEDTSLTQDASQSRQLSDVRNQYLT